MLCMCVSPFGCQATTVDNVPQRDQGFLCVTLCLLCARHAPVGSGGGGGGEGVWTEPTRIGNQSDHLRMWFGSLARCISKI